MGKSVDNNSNPFVRAASREQVHASLKEELRLSRRALVTQAFENLHIEGCKTDEPAIKIAIGAAVIKSQVEPEQVAEQMSHEDSAREEVKRWAA